MVMSWPKHFDAKKTIDAMVTHRDLFASLSEITGVAPKKEIDGKSLLPLIHGSVDVLHTEPMYWDSGEKQDNWVVCEGDWKLVYRRASRSYKAYELDENGLVKPQMKPVKHPVGMQLYNMAKDPGERTNLAEQFPERLGAMEQLYKGWRGTMADPVMGKK
jgi:arylsulfatase A-like enzyme